MDKNRKIDVMGIINITDNSYFQESRCLNSDGTDNISLILKRSEQMVSNGADILDIGACSTRPGSEAVGEEEEWRRLKPALKAIRREFPDVTISVDTYWPSIVQKVFDEIGCFIVNDVTGGNGMPDGHSSDSNTGSHTDETDGDNTAQEAPGEMLLTTGRLGLRFVAMHMRGNPKTMQHLTEYHDVTADILDWFNCFALRAKAAGVKDWILDPGFGFAKTVEQNYHLLRDLGKFTVLDRPILVGVSRKSMIFRKFNITPEESLPATQVLHYKALCEGASILRVHDVAEAVRTVAIYRELE